jgi:hypothetical protein
MINYNNLPDSCGNEMNCDESQMCKRCYSPAKENKVSNKTKHILRKTLFMLVCGLTSVGLAYGAEIEAKAGHITQGLLLMCGALFWAIGLLFVDELYE